MEQLRAREEITSTLMNKRELEYWNNSIIIKLS